MWNSVARIFYRQSYSFPAVGTGGAEGEGGWGGPCRPRSTSEGVFLPGELCVLRSGDSEPYIRPGRETQIRPLVPARMQSITCIPAYKLPALPCRGPLCAARSGRPRRTCASGTCGRSKSLRVSMCLSAVRVSISTAESLRFFLCFCFLSIFLRKLSQLAERDRVSVKTFCCFYVLGDDIVLLMANGIVLC